jgi:hypothetical protein
LASCVGSSAFGACLRARIGSLLPALVAFAATPRDDVGQIIAAIIVGNALIEDFDVALAAFRAACLRWPGESIKLLLNNSIAVLEGGANILAQQCRPSPRCA